MSENPNDYCRVCNCNFKVQFGVSAKKGSISFENIYKPSERKDSLGVVLANDNIPIAKDSLKSNKVCNPCGRKIRNLGTLYDFVRGRVRVEEESNRSKRRLETPDKQSPSWRKPKRVNQTKSPSSRKSLYFDEKARQDLHQKPNALLLLFVDFWV